MTPGHTPAWYEICVSGILEDRWLRRLEGLLVHRQPEGVTVCRGEVDQAGLHGLLTTIRDIGVELISVQKIDPPAGSGFEDHKKE
jgi:hypothetical protein